MKSLSRVCLVILVSAVIVAGVGCSRRDQQSNNANPSQATSAQQQAPPAGNTPSTPSSPAQAPPPGNPPATPGATAQNPGAPASSSSTPQDTGATAPAAPAAQPEVAQAPAPPPPPPPKPKTFRLPAGSSISVRTMMGMSTKTVKTGDPFQASLSAPIVRHGVVIAPRGADVSGIVADSDPGGRVKGVASLSLQIQSIRSADGQMIRVQTSPVVQQAKTTKKRDAVRTGIAAGAGALIGGIAGGGKGAAIGAGVGGGAGVATNMATRGAAAEIPAESILQFTLASPLAITEVRPGSLTKKASSRTMEPAVSDEQTPAPEPQ
jgi:hypothetical protein